MFGNFKEKIHNVQHDLSLGWRNFADKAKSVNKKIARKATLLSDGDVVESEDPCFSCNLEAGGDILKKYQLDWIEMHNKSLQAVERAVEADKVILDVLKKCQSVNDTLSVLHSELSILPDLTAQLEIKKSDMASLTTEIDILEEMMIELEDVCEKQEIERKKALHKARINNLKGNNKIDYQEHRAQLEQHRFSAREKKRKLERQASAERQHIFEDAFVKQMEYYSQFGITEKPIVDQPIAERSLADISIDDDSDLYHEFMDFLGPETQESEMPVEEGSDQEDSFSDDNTQDSEKRLSKVSDVQEDVDISVNKTDSVDQTSNPETHKEMDHQGSITAENSNVHPAEPAPETCEDTEQQTCEDTEQQTCEDTEHQTAGCESTESSEVTEQTLSSDIAEQTVSKDTVEQTDS